MKARDPDLGDVKSVLRADFETGRLFWLPRTPDMFKAGYNTASQNCKTWNTRFAGKEALSRQSNNGYCRGTIFGHPCAAHRVIWLLYAGTWPDGEIDHINGVRNDNRPLNLRVVTSSENSKNTKRRKDNTSGHTGVFYNPASGKWRAVLSAGRVRTYLGQFDQIEDAIEARKKASIHHGFHENHGRAR